MVLVFGPSAVAEHGREVWWSCTAAGPTGMVGPQLSTAAAHTAAARVQTWLRLHIDTNGLMDPYRPLNQLLGMI
jgi:hypothetical protein